VIKEDRNPERGRSSGIDVARRLRLDADDVAVSESAGCRVGERHYSG